MSRAAAVFPWPPVVASFCETNHLMTSLETAMCMAREAFGPGASMEVSLEDDPEIGEQVVVIDVMLSGSIEQALVKKSNYTRRWVESAPPEERERIRLLFDLI